jgi:hypothetical protein
MAAWDGVSLSMVGFLLAVFPFNIVQNGRHQSGLRVMVFFGFSPAGEAE